MLNVTVMLNVTLSKVPRRTRTRTTTTTTTTIFKLVGPCEILSRSKNRQIEAFKKYEVKPLQFDESLIFFAKLTFFGLY